MTETPYSSTLICIIFKRGDSWTPELFQHTIDDARQNHNITGQWHGTTLQPPHELYWCIGVDAPPSDALMDALKTSTRALADGEPEVLTLNMLRPWTDVLQAPITVALVTDVPNDKPISFVEQEVRRAADLQQGAKGFHGWTQGFSTDNRRLLFMGGWDSKKDHLELAASDREEDRVFNEVAEEAISLFASFHLVHVAFKEERLSNNNEDVSPR